nr:MAG TPA: Flagellin flagellum glycoprotein helical filament [Caudoviricetes sp.]
MGKIEEAIFCVLFVILLPFVLAVVIPTAAYVSERIDKRLRNK